MLIDEAITLSRGDFPTMLRLMPRQLRRFRTAAFAWAVLQIALPAMALFADAAGALEANRSAVVHVEESQGCSTDAPHELDCAVCQQLSSLAGLTLAGGDLPSPPTRADVAAPVHSQRGSAATCALPTSRAPPRS